MINYDYFKYSSPKKHQILLNMEEEILLKKSILRFLVNSWKIYSINSSRIIYEDCSRSEFIAAMKIKIFINNC